MKNISYCVLAVFLLLSLFKCNNIDNLNLSGKIIIFILQIFNLTFRGGFKIRRRFRISRTFK